MHDTFENTAASPSNKGERINPSKHREMVMVAYVLIALGYFTVLSTGVLGLIMAYIKRNDVRGTYLESHCTLLVSVFWWSMIWYVIAWGLFWTIIGIPIAWLIWGISYLWTAYALLKGFFKIHAEQGI
jgi:uncharacterized membrane protein